jgi:dTMP kinase
MTVTTEPDLGEFATPLQQRPHGGRGRLITVDGVDGSGKSTLVGAVVEHLRRSGLPAEPIDLMSRWPRRHPQFQLLAEDLANVAEGRADITALCAMCIGDRLATWRTDAAARVAAGAWLVVDRYNFTPMSDMLTLGSSPADQLVVRRLLELMPRPDLAVITDVGPATALDRVRGRPDEQDKAQRPELTERLVALLRGLGDAHAAVRADTSGPVAAALAAVRPALRGLRA